MITIAFFNCKGGAGTTSVVYHLAYMFRQLGLSVVAVDCDPQADLTTMFLNEDRLEQLWSNGAQQFTIKGAIDSIGDLRPPHIESVAENIALIAGDIQLAGIEEKLSKAWLQCMSGDEAAFRSVTAISSVARNAGTNRQADIVLLDIGPTLGSINRSALLGADFVITPIASDVSMLLGLRVLVQKLKQWRDEWAEIRTRHPNSSLPSGAMIPAGYVFGSYFSMRPGAAFNRARIRSMLAKVPSEYQPADLNSQLTSFHQDDYCLATLWRYPTLMPRALESKKPMFHLTPADGAIGSEIDAVKNCYQDFKRLAIRIAERTELKLPYNR